MDKAKSWQILDEILDEILDAPLEEREKILKERCGENLEMRGRLERMLSSVEADFLEDSLADNAFRVFEEETSDAFIGKNLGNFTLLKIIGQGGMGAVYLGERNDREFRQKVAVKLVSPIFSDKANSENFRRERQILAKLNHPAIARLLDGGTTDSGTPYLVMEYVEGVSVNEFCAEKNLSLKERLNLFLEICEAVKFAHQNLIIHRDLKPANILVTAEGKPKLLDFGIAKLLNPELLDITTDFTVGANILTPNYASPEQLKGETITTASDVYSLGVILYEILTGKRPHDLKSKSLPEMLRIITEEIPKTPSGVIIAENTQSAISNPQSLKGDIDTIVLKSLAKDSSERYQTVEELTADIVRYLNNLPILARKPSKIYQFKKFVRRNKIAFISGCVIFLLLSSLLGTAIYSTSIARRQAYENLRQAYSADMNLAMQAYETANLVQFHQILDKYKSVDFRGWEYDFLNNLANPNGKVQTFTHAAEVWDVAFSPDNKKMATACNDGFARIYEVSNGKLLATTSAREKNVWRVRFSPHGLYLATASGDSASTSAKIWNAETGAEIVSLIGHTDRVRAIDFSPDGKTVATGSRDGTIRLWNSETGTEIKKFNFENELRIPEIYDLLFSPDGTKIISATNQIARVYEVSSGKTLFNLESGIIWLSAAFSPDGKRFALGSTSGIIRLYETDTGKLLSETKENTGKINNLSFSPDGKLIVAASSDRTIRFFETDNGTEVQNLRVHFADAWGAAFSPDGKFIATAGTDFNVNLFSAPELLKSSSFAFQPSFGGGGFSAISADCKTIAQSFAFTSSIWDVETKSKKFDLSSGDEIINGAFSPDGTVLATGMRDGKIVLWNTANGAEIFRFQAHPDKHLNKSIEKVIFTQDGKWIISIGSDNLIKIWNADNGQLIRELWRFEQVGSALESSPDGKRIFAAGYDLSARIFNTETGEIVADLGKQTKPILSATFAPDGKTFATGGADSIIKIWQTSDGKLLDQIEGNAGFVYALTYTPDGKRLASASGDGFIRLWDTETTAQVLAIQTNSSLTRFLAFTPDGKTLISHGTQEKIRLWESLSQKK